MFKNEQKEDLIDYFKNYFTRTKKIRLNKMNLKPAIKIFNVKYNKIKTLI